MVAHIVVSTGMAWDQVEDQITIPRMKALYRYWEDHPPVHLIAAAMAGIEPRNKQKQYVSPEEFFGGLGG